MLNPPKKLGLATLLQRSVFL